MINKPVTRYSLAFTNLRFRISLRTTCLGVPMDVRLVVP